MARLNLCESSLLQPSNSPVKTKLYAPFDVATASPSILDRPPVLIHCHKATIRSGGYTLCVISYCYMLAHAQRYSMNIDVRVKPST